MGRNETPSVLADDAGWSPHALRLAEKPFSSGIYCAKATLCSWSGLAFVKVTAARIGDTIRRDAAAHCR